MPIEMKRGEISLIHWLNFTMTKFYFAELWSLVVKLSRKVQLDFMDTAAVTTFAASVSNTLH